MTDAAVRVWSTPAGVRLCRLDELSPVGARGFVLQMRHGRFHGFVVRSGETLRGYVDRCPHMGFPLAQTLDAYLSPDGNLIQCGWHGALFELHDGRSVGGPCPNSTLTPWPVGLVDGVVVTKES